jgi:hypothetical protein
MSTINAEDYDVLPATPDNGAKLNTLWAALTTGDTVVIPPGIYYYATPVVWTGKQFLLLADGASFAWNGANSQTTFTFGAATGDAVDSADESTIVGWKLYANDRTGMTAVKMQNANRCVLERVLCYAFATGLLHYCQGGTYISRDCILKDCSLGTLVQSGGQAGELLVASCNGGATANDGTVLDFSAGGGGNRVVQFHTQASVTGCYVVKGTNNNAVHLQYAECGTATVQWTGDYNLLITDRLNDDATFVVDDDGNNNVLIQPGAVTSLSDSRVRFVMQYLTRAGRSFWVEDLETPGFGRFAGSPNRRRVLGAMQ